MLTISRSLRAGGAWIGGGAPWLPPPTSRRRRDALQATEERPVVRAGWTPFASRLADGAVFGIGKVF